MSPVLERIAERLHGAVAAVTLWLLATSPWISMYRRLPRHPGVLDWAHVVLGWLAVALANAYLLDCLRAGRWRMYFPWAAGQFGAVLDDLRGLLRGRVPTAEGGGGLFAVIEGITLLLLVATACTGAAWFLTQGTAQALEWRSLHGLAARALIGGAVLHVVTVSLHLLDFVRD